MLFGLFENYTSTDSKSSRRKKMGPINVDRISNRVYDLLLNKIKEEKFINIQADPEYFDIYAEKGGFEISIQISANGMSSFVEFSVLGEHKRGRTRGFFKHYYLLFRDYLLSN